MIQAKTCEFTNCYSEIKGFQKQKVMVYSARAVSNGIFMSLTLKSESDVNTEACLCAAGSFDRIEAFMKYISENSIGLGSWYGILQDMDIPFTIL
ncbi:MAG: hypothetical protein ACI4QV_01760 [Acutalibacteraceae bacterium]